ncbi:MAG: hypothetical protein C4519_22150 [Desulfobacteraceae bacterium]|nr:MAG: hypothetical protein C4519_22150 [Desulfobacteraceae bacterium]
MRSYANQAALAAGFKHALWTAMTIVLILLPAGEFASIHAEGLEYGRFRISPKLAVVERYSDNIYLEPGEEEDDFYTEIIPEITLDFAIAPRNYISLKYVGNFFRFSDADNFDSQYHLGEASWTVETAKGSRFAAGASTSDTSVQPYSPIESAKDYRVNRIFAETILVAGQVTEFGLQAERLSRRFDDVSNEVDDYDRNQVDASIVYRRSEIFPLLLQYRFIRQDNEDLPQAGLDPFNRDYDTHSVFTGARWRPAGKLSGALRIGYTWSDFENDAIDEFSGLGMDIDLLYRFSPITRFNLIGRRNVLPTTIAERDTGTYYVLTSGGVRLTLQRWSKIITTLSYFYHHRDFQSGLAPAEDRVDREHVAALNIEWAIQRWISIILGYQYRNNDSDLPTVDYKENLVQLGVHLSI